MIDELQHLPDPHSTLGKYKIGRLVSQSVLGGIYEAHFDGKAMMVHVLPRGIIDADKEFLGNYRSAIKRMKTIGSELITHPMDLIQFETYTFCSYDFGGASSLTELIDGANKDKKRINESMVRDILSQVGNSLKAARLLELGHFFLTPDFVFIDSNGSIKVMGIGILESIKYEAFEYYVSRSISPLKDGEEGILTPLEILSPEIRDRQEFDTRGDFYGIGILSYFLLTGNKPVRNWLLPSKARPEIEPNWDLLISHCLEFDPSHRYASWAAFLNDLHDLESLEADAEKDGDSLLRRLEWIPLPESIQKKYSKELQMRIRLLLLGLVGLVSIAAGVLLLLILFEDPPEELKKNSVRRLPSIEGSNIELTISPNLSKVIVTGNGLGSFLVTDGSLHLFTGKGGFQIKVEAPLHKDKEFSVNVDNAKQSVQRTINLVIPWVDVNIFGKSGTDVYSLGARDEKYYIGTIGDKGMLHLKDRLIESTYRFLFSRNGYFDFETDSIEILGPEAVSINAEQEPKPAQLTIKPVDNDTVVFIDDLKVGEAPLEITNITPGKALVLEVRKSGYRSFIQTIELDPGASAVVSVPKLELKLGKVSYEISGFTESAAEGHRPQIFANDKLVAEGLSGELILPAGETLIWVEHPDYQPYKESIMIEDKDFSKLEVKIKPKPAILNLEISSDHPFRVSVNGTFLAEPGYTLELEPNRESEVGIYVRDFLVVRRRFVTYPNGSFYWEVPLMPIPGPEFGKDWNPPYFNLEMKWVPPGRYYMGTPKNEFRRLPNEDSSTRLTLSHGFWAGVFEVTQDLYERIIRSNNSTYKGENFPVETISWDQAMEFCKIITSIEKEAGRIPDRYEYRLPTEAEWEYLARYGNTTIFHFGDSASPSMGNFKGSYPEVNQSTETTHYGTMKVGSFQPNALGIYDLHGNVAEWIYDDYWDRLPGGSETDYVRLDGRGHSIRGGSWEDPAHRVRSGARAGVPTSATRSSIGFRVVLAPVVE